MELALVHRVEPNEPRRGSRPLAFQKPSSAFYICRGRPIEAAMRPIRASARRRFVMVLQLLPLADAMISDKGLAIAGAGIGMGIAVLGGGRGIGQIGGQAVEGIAR